MTLAFLTFAAIFAFAAGWWSARPWPSIVRILRIPNDFADAPAACDDAPTLIDRHPLGGAAHHSPPAGNSVHPATDNSVTKPMRQPQLNRLLAAIDAATTEVRRRTTPPRFAVVTKGSSDR
jgi:hypothetical protein